MAAEARGGDPSNYISDYIAVEQLLTSFSAHMERKDGYYELGHVVNHDENRFIRHVVGPQFQRLAIALKEFWSNQHTIACGGWMVVTSQNAMLRLKQPTNSDHGTEAIAGKKSKSNRAIRTPIFPFSVEKFLQFCTETGQALEHSDCGECTAEIVAVHAHEFRKERGKAGIPDFLCAIRQLVTQSLGQHCHFVQLIPEKVRVDGGGCPLQTFSKPTVKDVGQILGTVIICLPSYHKGGELKAICGDMEQEFRFSDLSSNERIIQWVAFPNDSDLEMKSVTEGYRVTVKYSVVSDTMPESNVVPDKTPKTEYTSSITTERTKSFIQVISNVEAITNLILEMKHLNQRGYYHIGIILETQEMTLDLRKEELKGKERLLYDAVIANADWRVTLQTVIIHKFPVDDPWSRRQEGPLKYTFEVISFTSNDLTRSEPAVSCPFTTDVPFIDVFNKHAIVREQLTRHFHYGKFGQEHFYIGKAMIVSSSVENLQ